MLRDVGVILSVVLTANREAVDEEVFELVHPSHSVLVEAAEIRQPSIDDIVGEDVELPLLRLELKSVDRLLCVTGVNLVVFAANLDYC